jgi:site-specific recombinase XerD
MKTGAEEVVRLMPHGHGGLIASYLHYLSEKKNRSALTLDSYQNDLQQFAAFLADPDDVDAAILNADADCARRFIDTLRDRYTPSTRSRKLTALRGFYTYLLSKKRLTANPFAAVRPAPDRAASFEFLEEAHLQRLFDTITSAHWLAARDRAIIAMLYSTGLRVGELVELTPADLGPDCRTVRIHTPGRPTRLGRLPAWAAHAVEQYVARRPQKPDVAGDTSTILFINRDGGPLTARSIRRKLADYSRQAHLPVEATPAVLRHSCAIHLLRAGTDPKIVRDLLGHLSASSIRPYLSYLAADTNPPAASEPAPLAAL